MKFLFSCLLLFGVCLNAADRDQETDAEKAAREERVKTRLAEHAHRKATQAAAVAETDPNSAVTPAAGGTETGTAESITTLPSMEVRQSRITALDLQIRKLEKDITRERKKMKSSDLDASLNDAKATRRFSLFGGKSTEQRESVAAERVQLMESECDILEAMKLPKSTAELALLQKQVDDLRIVRRELDLALR